jgi:hypothetical protein
MTAESGFLARIAAAEGHIRNARRSWNPASLSACAECTDQLQQAIDAMTVAEAAAEGLAPAGFNPRLDRLRADVDILSRLVDAAVAFNRGLALRIGSGQSTVAEVTGIAHV